MWQETKHGLYKQFVFTDFHHAWSFMEKVSVVVNDLDHHPRWQNEWNVVEFWLSTHEPMQSITEKDWELSKKIDVIAGNDAETAPAAYDDKITTQITEVQLYTDGGSRGNPGPSASGFVLLDMEGKVVHEHGIFLGITTNNQAEYQALKIGLEAALQKFQARNVYVYMDSMLVVNQMKRIIQSQKSRLMAYPRRYSAASPEV
ncbi:4a-hydroxytetrahydrobiopterin dehydratase [Candidatus Saccharibacteria bacterium]|nr:MAG: 4a-hydroxytetrahydrobiopterin dehydratase [Candidatus Saccharibacteria bacterium]